jgi:hypothetical protein
MPDSPDREPAGDYACASPAPPIRRGRQLAVRCVEIISFWALPIELCQRRRRPGMILILLRALRLSVFSQSPVIAPVSK